ncbi:MAG: hypothetical protein ABI383_02340, partial [Acidobacteriaceae bacterium]
LDPQLGAISADTWTLISTVARNLILNWFLLVPLIAVALLVPLVAVALLRLVHDRPVMMPVLLALAGAAMLLGIASVRFITLNLPAFGKRLDGHRAFVSRALIPLTLAAACLTVYWYMSGGLAYRYNNVLSFCIFGLLLHTAGTAVALFEGTVHSHTRKSSLRSSSIQRLFAVTAAAMSGLLGGWLTFAGIKAIHHLPPAMLNLDLLLVCGVPLVLVVFLVVTILLVGLTSKYTEDDDREWWARSGAYLLLTILIWLCIVGLALYGTEAIKWIADHPAIGWGKARVAIAGSGGILSFIVSKLGASSRGGPGGNKEAASGKPAFGANTNTVLTGLGILGIVMVAACVGSVNQSMIFSFAGHTPESRALAAVVGFAIEAAIVFFVAAFVNVNKFSLHGMYRNRLIRAYLGASWHKHPNPFTGFDSKDNIALGKINRTPGDLTRVERPLHVINMTLNLVEGARLAWQQRKAEPFSASTLHCGSLRVGYQPSAHYGDNKEGITLGTAVAISGAAASPNMGYHSSPILSVIMTFFNLRLGWWLANPGPKGRKGWKQRSPSNALRPLLDEAFGRTTDQNEWIYLSDGGHFENLALYEMVLRRCRHIVVVDAGADPDYTFEDLGNAVRKIRIDLGVSIDFRKAPLPSKQNRRHCAVATINYQDVDGEVAENGTLLYIKPVLCSEEPTDVRQYASTDGSFPQQPTSEQWFSESQFESYRRLGLHTVQHIAQQLKELGLAEGEASLKNLMACGEGHALHNHKVRVPLDVRVVPHGPEAGEAH